MITEPIESNRNPDRGVPKEAAIHALKDDSQRLLLYCSPMAAVDTSGFHTINSVNVRNTRKPHLIRLPHAVDIVKQIHDVRSSFSRLVSRSAFDDETGLPAASLRPSSLEMFVEGISHHFNNLFMAIQGYVSLLMREIEPDHAGMLHLRRIEKLVHCESILTNDLLLFLIGNPGRINRRHQTRLMRELEKIASSVEATARPRRAPRRSQAASDPTEQLLRSLSGSVAIILGRLLSDIQQQAAKLAVGMDAEARAFQRLRQISDLTLQGLRPVCQLLGYAGHTHLPNGHRVARCVLVDALQEAAASKGKNIRLFLDVDADLPKIKLRRRQLVQILMAVVDNAAEAMSQGGDLFLRAVNLRPEEIDEPGWNVPAKHFIRLTIRDSGRGFDPRFGRLVFAPFFTNKGGKGHHGLGLSCIYGMVNTLGGYIGVKTEPGQGTAFHIYLPSEKAGLPDKRKTDAGTTTVTAKQMIRMENRRKRSCAERRVLEDF